jgi:hypothetical protein
MVLSVLKSPSLWTAIIAMVAYLDPRALHGTFVYDDAGSVVKNVVVNGSVDWREAFERDFWGVDMKEAQSHKSFRPITTLSFKLNYLWAERQPREGDKNPPTLSFHVINILLHGLVTAMVTRAAYYILASDDKKNVHNQNVVLLQIIVGLLFGLHPVHAEVVSNITSRGEMLMSVFFLSAFLSYAKTRQDYLHSQYKLHPLSSQRQSLFRRIWGIYIWPWMCMTLSLFSKEQGATTLISLVVWDFCKYHGNVKQLLQSLTTTTNEKDNPSELQKRQQRSRNEAWRFLLRTFILALQTLMVVAWRYVLNGETSPDFIEAQNPAGFAKDRFTRAFSVTWVYCLYIRDALWPYYLCPDWSGLSIDLIDNIKDPRAMAVVALWYVSAQSLWTMVVGVQFPAAEKPPITKEVTGINKKTKSRPGSVPKDWWWNELTLNQMNIAIWGFTFSPFLLSSNILVVVGLMKADRVIYLPLFGFCLLEAILLGKFLRGAVTMRTAVENMWELQFWAAYFFLLFQLFIFSGRTHERNVAWSDSLLLWEKAYAINPKSHHTMYNYGYELSLKQRYSEAEEVLRKIGDPRVDSPSNTFVYAMVLFNLHRCNRAAELIEDAFQVIREKRIEGGPRNTDSHLNRIESNLLVAKAHCTDDLQERGKVLYRSVEVDPTNEYAIGLATEFMKRLEQMNMIN